MPVASTKEEQEKPLTGQYDNEYDSEEEESQARRRRKQTSWRENLGCNLCILAVAAIVSAVLGAILASRNVDLDSKCSAYTSQYCIDPKFFCAKAVLTEIIAPVLKDVKIKYDMVSFNGSFKAQTIYRQNASPEVDAAWEALGLDCMLAIPDPNSFPWKLTILPFLARAGVIPLSEGPASGLTPHHVQVSPEHGGGYFVNVEGLHHLHCLNLLRKGLWYNYEYYRALGLHAFKNEEPILQLHVSHCLDTLRQVLMCNVDTGVLGQVWYDHPEGPQAFPDFQSRHKCKNFDAVRDWAVALQAPPAEELPEDFMKAPVDGDVIPGDM
ncbi:uncharacterized protein PG986_001110 [Apiospora aurea]|uniref:Tat pathway signal sequence n=1 Tax=Apiospora aurea TaxID=335848 RepID=A0ABR1QW12_9PEZI